MYNTISANNELYIHKEGTKYIIESRDVEVRDGYKIATAKSLKEAIKKANDFMQIEVVEYGLNIDI